jgi:hypothetical protein
MVIGYIYDALENSVPHITKLRPADLEIQAHWDRQFAREERRYLREGSIELPLTHLLELNGFTSGWIFSDGRDDVFDYMEWLKTVVQFSNTNLDDWNLFDRFQQQDFSCEWLSAFEYGEFAAVT